MLVALFLAGCLVDRSGGDAFDAGRGTDAGNVDGSVLADSGTDGGEVMVDGGRDAAVDAGPTPFCDSSDPTLVFCLRCEGSVVDESMYAASTVVSGLSRTDRETTSACRFSHDSAFAVGDHPALRPTAMTVEFFFRADSLPNPEEGETRRIIIDKNASRALMLAPNGMLNFHAGQAYLLGPIVVDQWYHFAATIDETAVRTYLDGVVRGGSEDGRMVMPSGAALRIGEDSPTGNDQFLGAIDEVRIFSYARSQGQIAEAAAR